MIWPMQTAIRNTSVALAFALSASPASAQTATLDEAGLRTTLRGLKITPVEKQPGWLTIGTTRDPQVALAPFGFKLRLEWNGIDDTDWPFARIAALVASHYCGPVRLEAVDRAMDRLFKTRSLIPQRELGGNAGRSFLHRSNDRLGQCRIELVAGGARWHTITATVYRDEASAR